jgi:galactokinase
VPEVRAFAPGRVNLMGDHTDQTGGRVLPIAVDLGTSVEGSTGGDAVVVRSAWGGGQVRVPLEAPDPRVHEGWGRYVAAVVAEVRPTTGLDAGVATTLPVGAGLSSSAALELALALALGFDGSPAELASLGQRAEHAATGVPSGLMDQLASAAGLAGHALRIDCHTATVEPAPLPDDLEVVVAHSGVSRTLEATPYADRVAAMRAAEAVIGPLRLATPDDLAQLHDRVLRRRARHVVTENARVDALVAALAAGDRAAVGALLRASHASLRDDLDVSVPALDDLVAVLERLPGALGARATGAGFGGCAVAIVDRGAPIPPELRAWRVAAAGGATCVAAGRPSWPGTPRP